MNFSEYCQMKGYATFERANKELNNALNCCDKTKVRGLVLAKADGRFVPAVTGEQFSDINHLLGGKVFLFN